ncbi:hypothetical protein D3C87_80070 [compost metagenome]
MSITETFKINSLDISKLSGRVNIKPHEEKEILIKTTNEDKIDVVRTGSTLKIKTKENEHSNKKSFLNIFGGNNSFKNTNFQGNIVINGQVFSGNNISELTEVDMDIFVPKNQIDSIDISGVIKVNVDNISNSINIDSSGQTQITSSRISNIKIDVSGQSKAIVRDIEKLLGDISGQSKIDIQGAKISKVGLDISGQSDSKIVSDSIEELAADLSGMSKLTVYGEVKNKDIDKSGLSEITFK